MWNIRSFVANAPQDDNCASAPQDDRGCHSDALCCHSETSSCHSERSEESSFSSDVITSVEIAIKYAGYIEREKLQAQKNNRLEYIKIPADFDFDSLNGLSIECRQKLKRYKPETIAQASRISGVSPADISVLLVYFGR